MKTRPKVVTVETIRPRGLSMRDAATYLGIAEKTLRNRTGPRAKNPLPVKPRYIGRKPVFLKNETELKRNRI